MADEVEKSAKPARVVRYAPIYDQVLPLLRADIVENRWKAGERLSEPSLCEQFGVSRTPLRQVLTTLETEGFVQLVPHVGAVVTDPDAAEVHEKLEILVALEEFAAMRVTEAARSKRLTKQLRQLQADLLEAAKEKNAARYFALDDELHLTIVRGAGNRSLAELHGQIMWHLRRERHRVKPGMPATQYSVASREKLLRAIATGQPVAAGVAIREHRRVTLNYGRMVDGPGRDRIVGQSRSSEARAS